MSATMTFPPQHSSPLARTTSPFKDPRPPPCTPGDTAQIWDKYERRAVENAKRRDTTPASNRRLTQASRLSSGTVLEIIKSYDPRSSPSIPSIKGTPQFDFDFPTRQQPQLPTTESTTVAICKTCKGPIRSTLGICEACKKTIVLSSLSGQDTPPLAHATPKVPSRNPPRTYKPTSSGTTSPTSVSPKRRTHHSSTSAAHLFDPPIRLSSLKPPPTQQTTPRTSLDTYLSRPRKASLPDPSDMLPRLHITRRPLPSAPTTPPSTSHSYSHPPPTSPWATTRPCSLANVTTPPTSASAYHSPSARHSSATPSELSAMLPATSPPSVCRASYQLQTTMSAWEDSDSEDEEKRGLVKYWRGRRWRGSRGSLGGQSQARRDSAATATGEETGSAGGGKGRRRGFVRVISCGCDE